MNLFIVTHGKLSVALKETLEMFFGETEGITTFSLLPDSDYEVLKSSVEKEMLKLPTGSEILIFVDIFHGTPFNVCAELLGTYIDEYSIECFTGVNMPLLMEAYAQRNESLSIVSENIDSQKINTIMNLKKELFREDI